ncbi:MAG: hypothetical protein PVG70_04555 [Desulfobacterales bacterium]
MQTSRLFLHVAGLGKVVACWFGTPIGGLLIAIVLYRLLAVLYNRSRIDIFELYPSSEKMA